MGRPGPPRRGGIGGGGLTDVAAEREAWKRRKAEERLLSRARAALSRAGWGATREELEEGAAERWPEEAAAVADRAVQLQAEEADSTRRLDPATTTVRPLDEGLELEEIEKRERKKHPPQPPRLEGTQVPTGKPDRRLDEIRKRIREILRKSPDLTARQIQERVEEASEMSLPAFRNHVAAARRALGVKSPNRGGRPLAGAVRDQERKERRGRREAARKALVDAIREILQADPAASQKQITERLPSQISVPSSETMRTRIKRVRGELGIEAPRGGGPRPKKAKAPKAPENVTARKVSTGVSSSEPAKPAAEPPQAPPEAPAGTSAPSATDPTGGQVELRAHDIHLVANRQGDRVAIVLNATLPAYPAEELIRLIARHTLTP